MYETQKHSRPAECSTSKLLATPKLDDVYDVTATSTPIIGCPVFGRSPIILRTVSVLSMLAYLGSTNNPLLDRRYNKVEF